MGIPQILEDRLIRFTQPQAFNDPFELRPHVSKLSEDGYLENTLDAQFDNILEELYLKLPKDKRKLSQFSNFKEIALSKKDEAKENLKKMAKQTMPIVREDLYDGVANNIGILSLTTCSKNLLMWAHYANSHQGLVLEIDETHDFFNRKKSNVDEFRHLRSVKYSTIRPRTAYYP